MFMILNEMVQIQKVQLFESMMLAEQEFLLKEFAAEPEIVPLDMVLAFLSDPLSEGEYQDWRKFQKGYQSTEEPEKSTSKIMVAFCPLYWKLMSSNFRDAGPRKLIRTRVADFIQLKAENPRASFGSLDYPFTSGTLFSGLVHTALADNLRLIYRLQNDVLTLYGVFNHDDLGMGSVQQPRKKEVMAAKLKAQTPDEPVTPEEAIKML